MTLELLDKLREHATERPDTPAVRLLGVGREDALTWAQLCARTAAIATHLHDRLAKRSVVMLCSPNAPMFTAAFLGTLAAGMKLFPVSSELTPVEIADLAAQTKPSLVLGDPFALERFADVVDQAASFDALAALPGSDDASAVLPDHGKSSELLLLSSGTTSHPKIVRRTGRSLDAAARAIAHAIQLTADDAVLAAVPQCHSYGLEHGIITPTLTGARVTQTRGFDARAVLHMIADGDVTVLPGVPFMYEALAQGTDGTDPVDNLRLAYSAGAPLPASVFEALRDRAGVIVGQLYGSTEVGSVTFNAPDDNGFDPLSVGRAMNGVSIRILDPSDPKVSAPLSTGTEGHVAISSHAMLKGYVGKEAAPIVQDYFLTGDLGVLDARGRLTITGRIKLMIDVGGLKVNPLEVEAALEKHPSVGQCVVVGVSVSDTVSRMKAFVTPAVPGGEVDVESLRDHARLCLASFKVPRAFEVIAELPLNAMGKVDRRALEVA